MPRRRARAGRETEREGTHLECACICRNVRNARAVQIAGDPSTRASAESVTIVQPFFVRTIEQKEKETSLWGDVSDQGDRHSVVPRVSR